MNEKGVDSQEKKSLNPLIQIASAEETVKAQKAHDKAIADSQDFEQRPEELALERYLAEIFEDARSFKEDETEIQKSMLDDLRRSNGEYDPAKLGKIREANSSEAFIPITGMKCRSIDAFINDIYLNSKRKRTWSLRPTPIVTLSEKETKMIVDAVMSAAVGEQEAKAQAQAEPAELAEGAELADPNAAAPAPKPAPQVKMTPAQAYQMASEMRQKLVDAQYQSAAVKAKNMARQVDDQLTEGGFEKAMAECITDLSRMKALILKGPIVRQRTVKKGWKAGKIEYASKKVLTFERVSPLDFYPSRFSQHPNDGTPMCEKILLQRSSLVQNKKEDGYFEENINLVTMAQPRPAISEGLALVEERAGAENRDTIATGDSSNGRFSGSTLEGIEFYCSVRGADLVSFGIVKGPDGKEVDPSMDYEINAITVSGRIVFLEYNTDPLKRRPYSVCGFAREVGSFWYRSVPQIIKDFQDIINASARAMVNNLSWASGPQVIIPDINRLAPGEDLTNFYVGKIWQGVTSGPQASNKLIEFYQPDSRSPELMRLIEDFTAMIDKVIEMPAYSQGSENIGGAARTSSGLSMLVSSGNRGIKRVVLDIDRNVIQNVIEQVVDYNLEESDDDSIKGDMNFVSEGVMALMMKEQLSEQRIKFLQATQNEFDMKVIGYDGRAKILADAMESLESEYGDIAPSPEKIQRLLEQERIIEEQQIRENEMKIREKEALIQREAAVAQQEAQIKMAELEIKKREQDLEFKTKERELDIRAEKQSGDRVLKMVDQRNKAAKEGGGQAPAEPAGDPMTALAPSKMAARPEQPVPPMIPGQPTVEEQDA